MNFKEHESDQKLRGGYYTPPELAAFIARWVAANKSTEILEPSCGDGVFFEALACASNESLTVSAFELDRKEARKARARASKLSIKTRVSACDFLGWALSELRKGSRSFDAVVGNPPFIRYQYLPDDFQVRAESIFQQLECRFTKHTNAWVPFILASIALLRPGGRLGMVIPAELIHVTHAQSLRSFLGSTCRRLVVIDPERLWFSGTLQGAVILLAEKRRSPSQPSEGLGIVSVKDREFVDADPEKLFRSATAINGATIQGKWTNALLDTATRELLETTEEMPTIRRFVEVADVDVGIVTGANKFFLVPNDTVDRYSLHNHVYPMFGRSEHCPGVVYDERQHAANALSGKPTNFLWFKDVSDVQDRRVMRYIRLGEGQNLHQRYKCRIRSPWYRVPSVYATDIGMLKRAHHAPRLILNTARALTTDTVYRITTSTVAPRALVSSFLNPLTALSAELEGRHYGGGVLELIPSEIERLLVAIPPTMETSLQSLDHAVRTSCAADVLADHGQRVLSAAGLRPQACEQLLHAWLTLRNRRQRVSEKSGAENGAAGNVAAT